MVKLSTLIQSIPLAIAISATGVNSQDTDTVEWSLGMKLALFATSESEPSCPTTLDAAKNDATKFSQVQAASDVTSASSSASNLTTTFYFTNGLHELGTPFNSEGSTAIKVAEPASVGGGCWDTADEVSVKVAACNLGKPQTFYVSLPSDKTPFFIFASSLDAVGRPDTTSDALVLKSAGLSQFCAYDSDSGKLVVPPAENRRNIPQSQLTNLTSSTFGDTIPSSDSDVSQCTFSNGSTSASMLESLGSTDCVIARTFATMPGGCDNTPSNKTCILHLFPAFCLDLAEEDKSGPCIANPGGAACTSGLFAGIEFIVGGDNGGSTSAKRQANDPLFGNPESNIPLEDQFWIGVKNIINSAIGAFKLLATPHIKELRVTCLGVTHLTSIFDDKAAQAIREGCGSVFKAFNSVHELSYNNDVEKAGSIFADVVGVLSLANDVVNAAKAVGAVDAVLAKFGKATATLGETEGIMLEAKGEEGAAVQIFRNNGDGKAQLLHTDTEVAAMEKSIKENGFDNCIVCVEGGAKRLRRQTGEFRKLCCFVAPHTLEAPEDVWTNQAGIIPDLEAAEDAIPLAERTIATLSPVGGLAEAETELMTSMNEGFVSWYKAGQSVTGNMDDVSNLLLEVAKNPEDKVKASKALSKLYGISDGEQWTLRMWSTLYMQEPEFDGVMAKVPASTGWVVRATDLDSSTVKMLKDVEAGVMSKGTPGVYEVQDLVRNVDTVGEDGQEVRKIMAGTMGLGEGTFSTTSNYLFIIDSKSGRYIDPVMNGGFGETDFMQSMAGNFKLIGQQELNGGEVAKAAGKPGPFAVYYFQEIDAPVSETTVTLEVVRKALTDEGIQLP